MSLVNGRSRSDSIELPEWLFLITLSLEDAYLMEMGHTVLPTLDRRLRCIAFKGEADAVEI